MINNYLLLEKQKQEIIHSMSMLYATYCLSVIINNVPDYKWTNNKAEEQYQIMADYLLWVLELQRKMLN